MRLFYELFVANVDLSRSFYTDILGMKVAKDTPGQVELVFDQVQINLCPVAHIRSGHFLSQSINTRLGSRVEFCFEVEDVEAIYENALKAGVKINEPIRKQPWGRTDFRMSDPDGAYLRITTPAEY